MKLAKIILTSLLLVNTLSIFPVSAEEVLNSEEEAIVEEVNEEELETAESQDEIIIPEVEENNEEEVEIIPTEEPVIEVIPKETPEPTIEPTPEITPEPTVEPTPEVTPESTVEPTPESTPKVTIEPTIEPENLIEEIVPTEEPVVLSEETPKPTIESTPEVLEEIEEGIAEEEAIEAAKLPFAYEISISYDASDWMSPSKAGTVYSGDSYRVNWNKQRKTVYFKFENVENSLFRLVFGNPDEPLSEYVVKIYKQGQPDNLTFFYNTKIDKNIDRWYYDYTITLPKGTYYFSFENVGQAEFVKFFFNSQTTSRIELEPNNSKSTATPLEMYYFYEASYSKGLNNDKDFYKIDLEKGKEYQIRFAFSETPLFNATEKLDVITPSGKNIGGSILKLIKESGDRGNFIAEEDGTYYICVYDNQIRSNNGYAININKRDTWPTAQMTGVYNSVKGIDVRWKKVNDPEVTGYMVWRKNRGIWTRVAVVDADTTQFYDEEVKSEYGKIYVYSISLVKGNLHNEYDEKGRSICRLAPPKLNEVTDASNTSAKVKWTFADKATGYYIQYATNSSFTNPKFKTVEGRNTLETTVTGLTKGTKYYFRVRSYRIDDNNPSLTYYSQWTSVKEFTPGQQTPIPQLTAIYNSSKGVDFRFKPVDGASHYVIWRKNQGVWTKLDTVPASSLAKEGSSLKYFDASVKDHYGKIYVYSVAAICNGKEGKYNEKGRGICRLEPPRNPSVREVDAGIRVMWDWVEKNQGYEIQVATKSDFSDMRKIWVPGKETTSQVIRGVKQGQTYYIRIRSRQIDSNSITYWSQYTKVLKITPTQSY